MRNSLSSTDARRLQQRIAQALLPSPVSAALGSIHLLPHQQSAVARLLRILHEHHGALLADDVGLGKTFVALAVAHHYPHVHVLAPAGLLGMWQAAIGRAGPERTVVHSIHAYSRNAAPTLLGSGRTLVVIDEAHYLRNAKTARYRAVAKALAGCDVLLLTATPLHNRAQELRTLCALFRGDRNDTLTAAQRAVLIVRRTNADLPATRRPIVHEHAAVQAPQDRETLTHILSLPAPLPAHDGAVAGALIRLGLLRAWCSSDAALTHALRQRHLRGSALRDALHAGRHPTQSELRSWVVGDSEGQLAFPELLAQQPVESGPLLDILQRHLEALAALAAHHRRYGDADTERAQTLRRVLEEHPDTPIVAFSQFTRTVSALQRALADIAGVAVVTSRSGRIASGPLARDEVLANFAPHAHGRPPPPPHQRIRLLLATDLIAEGVNLQDAGVVVHLDLPWTHALRIQRVGRCARLGSPHAEVHVYRLAPSPFAEQALRQEERLARKHALTRTLIGANGEPHGTQSAAERASVWHSQLEAWSVSGAPECDRNGTRDSRRDGPSPSVSFTFAVLQHSAVAALAWTSRGSESHLVAVVPNGSGWRVQTALRFVLPLTQAVDSAVDSGAIVGQPMARRLWNRHRAGIRAALRRWWQEQRARNVAGQPRDAVTNTQRTSVRLCERLIRQLPTAARLAARHDLAAARRCIALAVGAGAEAALVQWCAIAPTVVTPNTIREWLVAWRANPLLLRLAAHPAANPVRAGGDGAPPALLRAVFLLLPD